LKDISNNKIRLLLSSGEAPSVFIGQEFVEDKFNFKYDDFGCISPAKECIKLYNFEVFKFMDQQYGRRWRKKVRSDVVGLKEYKKRRRSKR